MSSNWKPTPLQIAFAVCLIGFSAFCFVSFIAGSLGLNVFELVPVLGFSAIVGVAALCFYAIYTA